jgi:hypothetical protein
VNEDSRTVAKAQRKKQATTNGTNYTNGSIEKVLNRRGRGETQSRRVSVRVSANDPRRITRRSIGGVAGAVELASRDEGCIIGE